LLHESLDLVVDVERAHVRGVAELVVVPLTSSATTLRVNARQLVVSRVSVNKQDVRFEQFNFLDSPVPSSTHERCGFDLDTYASQYAAALEASDNGELVIAVPPALVVASRRRRNLAQRQQQQQQQQQPQQPQSQQKTDDNNSNTSNAMQLDSNALGASSNGVAAAAAAAAANNENDDDFDDAIDANLPVMSTLRQRHRRASTAVVTTSASNAAAGGSGGGGGGGGELTRDELVDDECFEQRFASLVVRVEYELVEPLGGMHFVLADGAHAHRAPHMFTDSRHRGARCWMPCFDSLSSHCTWSIDVRVAARYFVVASGDLLAQRLSPDELHTTFSYELPTPTLASSVALAVASFARAADVTRGATVTHFCLPQHAALLVESTTHVVKFIEHCERYLGVPMPYGSQKFVFVEDAVDDVASFASMTICSVDLLARDTSLDSAMFARRKLALAVAAQWFGQLISPNNRFLQ
jgi:hypothetical protein